MKKRNVIISSTCVLLLMVGAWFFWGKSPKNNIRLVTEKATRNTIRNVVTATGTVEPVISVEVGTQVSGIIDKIYLDYNTVVKKGQLIAAMDKVTWVSELQAAKSEVARNNTERDFLPSNYSRIEK